MLARILLDERIAPRQLIGIAVIITGLVIYFFPPKFMTKTKRTVI